jgi:homoserine dehydrogenase
MTVPSHVPVPATGAAGGSPITFATASAAGPDTVGFRSSGQSPGGQSPGGQSAAAPRTLHLVGPGHVGAALLARLGELPLRLIAVSDSAATAFDRQGLDPAAIAAHKRAGGSLASWYRAEALPTELAIGVIGADVVVDASPSSSSGTEAAVQRGRAALRAGAFLALCGKNALAAAAPEWLLGVHRGQVGIDAVLGGTGRQLVSELPELREHARALALVGNVTTTVVIEAIERGASLADGVAAAAARGLLEPDPALDLDGHDAATKLCAVWAAVFGETFLRPPTPATVVREAIAGLDPTVVRARAQRGRTTRLVARGSRTGGDLRVRFEEVPLGSPLAAPPDRVVYGYELPAGLRVHTGLAVGHDRTAQALLGDLRAWLRGQEVRS